ncbi:MAG: NADH-quinone oxidoreductase subunit NuoN [Marmoricola sp.]
MKFDAPHLEYSQLAPLLIVLGVATLGVLVEAAVPRTQRYAVQVSLAVAGLVAAIADAIWVFDKLHPWGGAAKPGRIVAEGALTLDGPAIFCWLLVLAFSLLSVLLFAERRLEGGVTAFAGQAAALPGTEAEREASTRGLEHTEVFPLMMFAVAGMMIFPASNDLITMFVGLEVLSLPLYLLCGLARRRRLLSQEAALKYFMLGAFSSGFFVYGMALVYGYSGSMELDKIAFAVAADSGPHALLLGGMGMLLVGLLFKVGAAPFQAWVPDVYQGAPTSVTAFMAAGTKVAAFGALFRLFYVGFGGARWDWMPVAWAVAILTMVVGSLMALAQTDVKRLLAYSSVAHAGFMMTAFLGARSLAEIGPGDIQPVQAVLFYLTTYGLTNMAAFAIVTLVRDSSGEATSMSSWTGIGKQSPLVAGTFAFLLLALAGIPLTSGFTAKWAAFTSAMSAGAWPVVIVAVMGSAAAAFFYVRIIVLMFFTDPVSEGASVALPSVMTTVVIAIGAAGTLVLGVVPGPLLDLLGRVAEFVR